MSWLLNLLCGGCKSKAEQLEASNADLQDRVNTLTKNYVSCLGEKSEIIMNCSKDVQYLSLRVLELSQMLAKAVSLPELVLPGEYPTIQPHLMPELYDYDMVMADLTYHTFPKDKWVEMLAKIQPEMRKALGSWVIDISDCDDMALVMNAFMVIAFKSAGLRYQGAFMIAWSRTHAYNLYVDDENKIWIYEPQNGNTVGLLSEGTDSYDTKKIWFIGEVI